MAKAKPDPSDDDKNEDLGGTNASEKGGGEDVSKSEAKDESKRKKPRQSKKDKTPSVVSKAADEATLLEALKDAMLLKENQEQLAEAADLEDVEMNLPGLAVVTIEGYADAVTVRATADGFEVSTLMLPNHAFPTEHRHDRPEDEGAESDKDEGLDEAEYLIDLDAELLGYFFEASDALLFAQAKAETIESVHEEERAGQIRAKIEARAFLRRGAARNRRKSR